MNCFLRTLIILSKDKKYSCSSLVKLMCRAICFFMVSSSFMQFCLLKGLSITTALRQTFKYQTISNQCNCVAVENICNNYLAKRKRECVKAFRRNFYFNQMFAVIVGIK